MAPTSGIYRGYGFVCFAKCEDARKALEHFHEKGDESSIMSMDVSKLTAGNTAADVSTSQAQLNTSVA